MSFSVQNLAKKKNENIFTTITDDEREKMEKFKIDRELLAPWSYSHDASLVLDDFLFLGSLSNACDRDFLHRYEISESIEKNCLKTINLQV